MNMEQISEELIKHRKPAASISADVLEPIPYENPGRQTEVEIENPEFTSLCPKTGLPDYGTIRIVYTPDQFIVELKSLKYYFLQFRNAGIFYEHLTTLILNHLVDKLNPFRMSVEAVFTSRGGISSKVVSRFEK